MLRDAKRALVGGGIVYAAMAACSGGAAGPLVYFDAAAVDAGTASDGPRTADAQGGMGGSSGAAGDALGPDNGQHECGAEGGPSEVDAQFLDTTLVADSLIIDAAGIVDALLDPVPDAWAEVDSGSGVAADAGPLPATDARRIETYPCVKDTPSSTLSYVDLALPTSYAAYAKMLVFGNYPTPQFTLTSAQTLPGIGPNGLRVLCTPGFVSVTVVWLW